METHGVRAQDPESGIREDSWKRRSLSLGKKNESPPKIGLLICRAGGRRARQKEPIA